MVNEYNNAYHRTIKIKQTDAEHNTKLTLVMKWIIKILNSKFVIM